MGEFRGAYQVRFAGAFVMRRKLFLQHSVPLFEFQMDSDDPLTFCIENGSCIRPNRTFSRYDFGSVPLLMQGLVSPLCSPRGFACHDSFYEFHCCWSAPGVPEKLSRKRADRLLYEMMLADHCRPWTALTAWVAVRALGASAWGAGALHSNEGRLERVQSMF